MTPSQQPNMKNYLYRETLVIEIELNASDEDSVMETGTHFVCDMLRKGQINAEMQNTSVRIYRIKSEGADVNINN
jgi:hypothetical protein